MTKTELLKEYRAQLIASGVTPENARVLAPDTFLRKSKADLAHEVLLATEAARAARKKRATEEYWKTPEGVARREAIDARLEEIKAEHLRLIADTLDTVAGIFHRHFPDVTEYRVADSSYVNSARDRLYLQQVRDGSIVRMREIEISYDMPFHSSVRELRINPATIGSVNILESSADTAYFITIGKLFERAGIVKEMMEFFASDHFDELEALRDEARSLQDEIKNPAI